MNKTDHYIMGFVGSKNFHGDPEIPDCNGEKKAALSPTEIVFSVLLCRIRGQGQEQDYSVLKIFLWALCRGFRLHPAG